MALPLGQFVAERRPVWERLAALVTRFEQGKLHAAEVEALDQLYRRCAADLARARTAYPGSDATLFLNGLVSRAYATVYGERGGRWALIQRFYREDFPGAFYRWRAFFAASWALLGLGAWLGVAVALFHPEAAPALVPIEVRLSIAAGHMWTDSLLEVMPPALLSTRILTNNIGVAFSTFLGGLPFGVGTVLVLIVNGLNLGVISALCVQRGMTADFLSFVLAHGLVELSVVALAGQAGLLMASALWAPGERSRADALAERGREGVRIVLGGTPILGFIGLVEGFISPNPLFPGPLKAALGLLLVGSLYGYLWQYGRRAQRLKLSGAPS